MNVHQGAALAGVGLWIRDTGKLHIFCIRWWLDRLT